MAENVNEEEMANFVHFIDERHRLFVNRYSGLPQSEWTHDPILSSGRSFTNVFRVLDRGTQCLVRMLWSAEGLRMDPYETLILCMVYRRTNNTDFWEQVEKRKAFIPECPTSRWFGALKRISDETHTPVFDQHPYLIVGSLNKVVGDHGDTMLGRLADLTQQWTSGDYAPQRNQSLSDVRDHFSWKGIMTNLQNQSGISEFLAQQITTDFGYSQYGNDHFDDNDVVLGPGSRRGIRLIMPQIDLKNSAVIHQEVSSLRVLISYQLPKIDLRDVGTYRVHRPTLMDIQNCLCEFDKYRRIDLGGMYRRKWHDHGVRQITLPESWL